MHLEHVGGGEKKEAVKQQTRWSEWEGGQKEIEINLRFAWAFMRHTLGRLHSGGGGGGGGGG